MFTAKLGCLLLGCISNRLIFNNLYGKTVIQIFFLNLTLKYKKFIIQYSNFLLQYQPKQIAYEKNYLMFNALFCFSSQ